MSNEFETEREKQLAAELQRTQYVWSNFIHNLCHDLYPERVMFGRSHPFKGSPEERILEIFKIMDHEVRHIAGVFKEAKIDDTYDLRFAEQVFEEISQATGITEISHRNE